jgi:hypothetical protein
VISDGDAQQITDMQIAYVLPITLGVLAGVFVAPEACCSGASRELD